MSENYLDERIMILNECKDSSFDSGARSCNPRNYWNYGCSHDIVYLNSLNKIDVLHSSIEEQVKLVDAICIYHKDNIEFHKKNLYELVLYEYWYLYIPNVTAIGNVAYLSINAPPKYKLFYIYILNKLKNYHKKTSKNNAIIIKQPNIYYGPYYGPVIGILCVVCLFGVFYNANTQN